MAENPQKLSTKAAGVVGLAVMCSRVLGLVREQIFAGLFGGGRAMDAFTVAFRTPNLLRDLFAEGALSTAFITTFSKKIATEGDESAWDLARKFATLMVVFLSVVVLVGIAIAPLLVKLFAPGFDPEKAALTVLLARIMYPFILLVSLAALVMGMLNARHVFGVPAMASSFFNLGSIVGGIAASWWLEPEYMRRSLELILHPNASPIRWIPPTQELIFNPWLILLPSLRDLLAAQHALIGLALGTLIGGALQLLVQFPSLIRAGFHYRPDFRWNDPGVRQILLLMGPAVIAASSVQVNVMINTMFASTLGDGPIFWLQIAFRLMQLPLGIFGVAIGTVTLPLVAKSAATGNIAEFRSILARGMRLAFLLTVPSTIGLILLADPIISVLYQHGKFSAHQTHQAAMALQFYATGLCAYSAMKVLVPAFYAIDKRKTPMMVSFLAIGTNLLMNWIFTFKLGLGHRGLALSTGIVAMVNFALLYSLMRRHVSGLETRQMLATLAKIGVAGLLLALVCWAGNHWLLRDWAMMPLMPKLAALLGTIAVAAGAFFGAAWALRIEEISDLAAAARRKLVRR